MYKMKAPDMISELTVILKSVSPTTADNVTEKSSLRDGLGLDVTGLILFAVAVEDNYDIRFNDADNIETVGDMIDYILTEKGR
ncbi:MAG: hypothetical protein K2G32_06430 [Oscillospiraceae bacterium]|nr:hypothetical protein [Oscillospiraceae bacterium]